MYFQAHLFFLWLIVKVLLLFRKIPDWRTRTVATGMPGPQLSWTKHWCILYVYFMWYLLQRIYVIMNTIFSGLLFSVIDCFMFMLRCCFCLGKFLTEGLELLPQGCLDLSSVELNIGVYYMYISCGIFCSEFMW